MVQTIPGPRMTDADPLIPHLDLDALDVLARQLEASGHYRLLRRLTGNTLFADHDPDSLRQGVYLDVETTGKDAARDEIIELAMVPFGYDAQGRLCSVGTPFVQLREPSMPISEEITRITGITNEMVAGKSIDPDQVAAFIEPAVIIAAHNAQFDRRFAERFCPAFQHKGWACSMSQVDWAAAGFEGTKLSALASQCGFFFDGHRAENDCLAGLEILSRTLPSGATALAHMLEAARKPTWRIWAERSPFDFKDRLKARGYRWNGEEGPTPKAWYIDIDEAQRDAELDYLHKEIYGGEVHLATRRITAFERFSDRV
jgi:DNA polymerase-3 subunit epsilon